MLAQLLQGLAPQGLPQHGPNWHRRRLQQNPDLGVWPGMGQATGMIPDGDPRLPPPPGPATGMIPGGDPRIKRPSRLGEVSLLSLLAPR